MMKMKGFGLDELDSMLPWERYIYVNYMIEHVEEEKKMMNNIGKK